MVFPLRGGVVSLSIGGFLWLVGFPEWAAFTFGLLGFLGMGGLQFSKLAYRTLPRDLWMGKNFYLLNNELRKVIKNKVYVTDLFQETVKKYPNKVAILFEDRKITFRELDELSNKIANLLRTSTGLRHGDCMAIFMENCPEYLAVFLACSKIGVTSAFINHNLRNDSLAHCIHIANCSGIFFSPSLADHMADILSGLDPSVVKMLYSVGGVSFLPQGQNLETEIESVSSNAPPPVPGKSAEDSACYIYTSGTTGLPKACKLKHSRYIQLQRSVSTYSQFRHDDILYIPLPLYHTNGGVLGCGQMLFMGSTVAIRKKFSASNFWTDCIRYKCTVSLYIGEICRYVLAQPKKPADTQHCVRLMTGNGLRYQIWSEFTKRFQIPQICEFYGSTEGNVGLINPFNKPGACGCLSVILSKLNPVTLIKINPETGEYIRDSNGFCVRAGFNEPGEVVGKIRTYLPTTRFEGYSDSAATKKKVMTDVFTIGDRYFLSGDILRMNEEGYLYFCDRTGDTFRWKGENVSTTEVESVMANILHLRDVVVYGVEVPGNEGRAGMAAIVGTEESVDLSGLAQQLFLSLPAYAVPLFIRLIPFADLTGTFKLKKVKLRNEAFDMSLPDPLFMLDTNTKVYRPLTDELFQKLNTGTIRV